MLQRTALQSITLFAVFTALLIAFTLPARASVPVTFSTSVTLPTNQVGTITTGDVDLDGHQDVVDMTATGFTVFYGRGNATFDRVDYALTGSLTRPLLADLNNDGLPDLVASMYGGNTVVVFLNQGARSFAAGVSYVAGNAPAGIAAGDFNGDGVADLAVANNHSQTFSVLLNHGDGTFGAATNYQGGAYPISVAVADFDGDGRIDIAETSHYENFTRIYRGNGAGSFTFTLSWPAGGGDLVVGDYNRDGDIDIAVANYWSSRVYVALGDGAGGSTSNTSYGSQQYPWCIASADMDGDGYSDIVVPNAGTNRFSVLVNNGDGTFGNIRSYTTPANDTRQTYIGDFNEDGAPDVAVATGTTLLLVYTNNTFALPTITAIDPDSLIAGTGPINITVSGSQFLTSAAIAINGVTTSTTYLSSTSLSATLPAALVSTAGTLSVTVVNLPPFGAVSNAILLPILNPTPVLQAIAPETAVAGSGSFVLTLTGTGFLPTTRVVLGGSMLDGTLNADGTFSVTVPAAAIAAVGPLSVTATNPTPGGGDSNTLTLAVVYPVPAITALAPSTALVGSSSFPLTVTGANFVEQSVVSVGGTPLPTTLNADGTLTVTVPASLLAVAGALDVTVTNPSPGGGLSNTLTLAVVYPVPAITALAPSTALVGSSSFLLTVTGSNFVEQSVVSVGGTPLPTTFNADGTLTVTVPASLLAVAGALDVTVTNPSPGGGLSNTLTLPVLNPTPAIDTISPSVVKVGSPGFTLTVTGSGFMATSTVFAAGVPLATTFTSGGTLTAVVPASMVATADSLSVTVTNPSPGGGLSNSVKLTVGYSTPVLNCIWPTSAKVGSASITMVASGTGFVPGVSQILFGPTALPATLNSRGQWVATVPASLLTTAGIVPVALQNPGPGGGTSASKPFTITNPRPILVFVNPRIATAGRAVTITLYGLGFVGTSQVYFGSTLLASTLSSDCSLSVELPATVPAGVYAVKVVNAAPGGGTSNMVAFTLANPAPHIASLSPDSVLVGTPVRVTLTGSGFTNRSRVYVGCTAFATTLTADGALTIELPATVPPGVYAVKVLNPAPGGGTSNTVSFTVTNPVPHIASLSPESAVAGTRLTITLTGSGFTTRSRVYLGASALSTTLNANGTLSAVVPASTESRTHIVTVTNPAPGGGTSNHVNLQLTKPKKH
ncbi:MAG TPA: IPT/TIG domain-containing protein [Capsulimonadaceae bacterium]|jgi:hypothetical protein